MTTPVHCSACGSANEELTNFCKNCGVPIAAAPDGHPKLPHLWPVKLPQAGRIDYDGSGLMAMRAAASLSR